MSADKQVDLTDKQERFALAYASHFDAKKAAKDAGYSEKTADIQAYQLLCNPKVKKKIHKHLELYANEHSILKKRILNQLVTAAFSDINEFAHVDQSGMSVKDWSKLPKHLRMLVSEVSETSNDKGGSFKFKLVDKMRAIELLGRHLAMFTDKVEHSVVKPTIIERLDGGQTVLDPGGEDE